MHRLSITQLKESIQGRRKCFALDYINDKEKVSRKIFSVDDVDLYPVWVAKIRLAIQEFKEWGPLSLVSPETRPAKSELTSASQVSKTTGHKSLQDSARASTKIPMTPAG